MTPGDWYARRREEADRAAVELRAAKLRNADAATIRRLQKKLDAARYVGD